MKRHGLVLLSWAFALLTPAFAAAAVIAVPAGGDLQAALDRAQPGDVVTLQPGAIYVGNYVLGVKPGATYITIRSAVPDRQLPPDGTRITPGSASALARLQSPNGDPALRTIPGAHHWRLLFLEFGPSASGAGEIVRLGDGSAAQNQREEVPNNLVVDRCYIHGDPGVAQRRGIALNSASTSILNSWIAEIKTTDEDSQAIGGWNGPGPFVISNNYLEAAGENIMFGGGDASIDGLVPTGITIRGNWLRKPVSWRNGPWQVKNLLELKNARGVVIEGNLIENNWQAAQPGHAILFTPRNDNGRAPWSTVQDVTVRGNVIRHVAAAFNILGRDNHYPTVQARGITIQQNLVYDVTAQTWGGNGSFLLVGDGPADLHVEHNTVMQSGDILIVYGAPQATGFVFRNNMVLHNQYGMKGDSQASGTGTINAYFPGAVVTRNAIAGGPSNLYPSGNLFPSVAEFYAQFANPAAENFQLASASAAFPAASDGGVIGADPRVARTVATAAMSSVSFARPRTPAEAARVGK